MNDIRDVKAPVLKLGDIINDSRLAGEEKQLLMKLEANRPSKVVAHEHKGA